MGQPPYIVNLAPPPDEANTGLTAPIRFSVRDIDSYVVPGLVRITVGYAKVRASGEQLYEEVIPRTTLSSVLFGLVDTQTAPSFVQNVAGWEIAKTIDGLQKSVYFTSIDAGSGYQSVLAMVGVLPMVITDGEPGAVIGLENGPRGTGVYVFFQMDGVDPVIRFCGPANSIDIRLPDTQISLDWTIQARYFLVWNELRAKVELYRIYEGATELIHEEDIALFQPFDPVPGGTPQYGGDGDMSLIYGIEGVTGEKVLIGPVALTLDVGFPIVGLVRTGEYFTTRRSDETIRYAGSNPLKLEISPWFGPDDVLFDNPDAAGVIRVIPGINATTRLTKLTSGSSMALYREEPGFRTSDVNGFMVEAKFFGTSSLLVSSRITGMGFFICDGSTVYYLGLLSGATRTVGILRAGGDPASISSYITPAEDLDWSSATTLRLTVDIRRELEELYGNDLLEPLLSLPIDSSNFPTAADFGVDDTAFIAFGHIHDLDTLGSFDLTRLNYAPTYQAFEAIDGYLPDEIDPAWTSSTGSSGSGEISPLFGTALLGGGYGILPVGLSIGAVNLIEGTAVIEDGEFVLETPPSIVHIYTRPIPISSERGAVVEFRTRIVSYKPRARTGFYVIIDDGLKTYCLSFVDTEIGKFVAIPIKDGVGMKEVTGTEGQATTLSTKIDWDNSHIYRFERRPLDGVYLFIDNNPVPTLYIPESSRVSYPTSLFSTPVVAFGHLSNESARSITNFVRVMYSKGYEISIKKVDSTTQLEQDIRNSQAMVITFVEDDD